MPAQYKVILYSPAGVKQAEFVDFDYLTYTKRLNAPGALRLRASASHAAAAYFVDKAQIEVYRRNTDPEIALDWYADFTGILRDDTLEQTAEGRDIITLDSKGALHMLEWRIVDFKADAANRSSFTNVKGETLLKTLVQYNITASATTGNSRNSDGTMTSPVAISIQADAAGGNTLNSWGCAWRPLLEELQAIAKVAGGDFDLIKTGAATYQFQWFLGQRGTDRRTGANLVKFDTKWGNMARPKLIRQRSRVRTKAIVAGSGSSTAREYASRTGNGYAANNVIEIFVDARNLAAGASLNAEGDVKLYENRQFEDLSFNVIQMPTCYYGKHYCTSGALGDLVNVAYQTYSATHKITAVTVAWDDKGESIQVESEVYP